MNKISVIVCSLNETLRNNLLQNIATTIGCDFEFLYEDNREKNDGICFVYNRLARKAQGNFLCFVHEDVEFKTLHWGCVLKQFASNPNVGVIGMAGSPAVTGYIWWDQAFSYCKNTKPDNDKILFGADAVFSKSLLLDGLFLFARKEVWSQYPFDETVFQGFHLYDMDFSLSSGLKYQNYSCHSIDYIHFSEGNANQSYYENLQKFNRKWVSLIPYSYDSAIEFDSFKAHYTGIKRIAQGLIFSLKKTIPYTIKYIYAIRKKYSFLIILIAIRYKIEYITGLYRYIYERYGQAKKSGN
ncbi:MAG: glycosyltransferase family protein [Dysgonamonadaceae bacterium]|nr:glycosyltransferase family protein [Dysgonamonadaceae bacterium]